MRNGIGVVAAVVLLTGCQGASEPAPSPASGTALASALNPWVEDAQTSYRDYLYAFNQWTFYRTAFYRRDCETRLGPARDDAAALAEQANAVVDPAAPGFVGTPPADMTVLMDQTTTTAAGFAGAPVAANGCAFTDNTVTGYETMLSMWKPYQQ